jgi:hypothetical protein
MGSSAAPKLPSSSPGGSPERKFVMKNGHHQSEPKTELDHIVARIGQASKALNTAADAATRRIEALEERLVAAEPGVSLWGATLLTEKTSIHKDEGPAEVGQRVVTLGFDRVKKDKWGIAVREELKGKKGVVEEDVSLLRKADRSLRLLALPHLEALARQIAETLEAHVSQLEELQRTEKPEAASAPIAAPTEA